MTAAHDETPTASGHSRRDFLVGGAAAVAGITAVGTIMPQLAGAGTRRVLPTARGAATKKTAAAKDLEIARLAAGLEVLAVGTYRAALDAATTGTLGAVPPAGAQFVQTALAQHQEHLDAWNGVITGAGKREVTKPNARLKRTVDKRFASVTDFGGAAMLARDLEEIAAATYLAAVPEIDDGAATTLAGSIQCVDQQHVAVLNYVLGEYPVPDVFQKTGKAVAP